MDKYDIVVLVETWLNESIADAELGFDDFNIFRMDRDLVSTGLSRRGRVLIAVRKCWPCFDSIKIRCRAGFC